MLLRVETLALILLICSLNVKLRSKVTQRYTGHSVEAVLHSKRCLIFVGVPVFKVKSTNLGFALRLSIS